MAQIAVARGRGKRDRCCAAGGLWKNSWHRRKLPPVVAKAAAVRLEMEASRYTIGAVV